EVLREHPGESDDDLPQEVAVEPCPVRETPGADHTPDRGGEDDHRHGQQERSRITGPLCGDGAARVFRTARVNVRAGRRQLQTTGQEDARPRAADLVRDGARCGDGAVMDDDRRTAATPWQTMHDHVSVKREGLAGQQWIEVAWEPTHSGQHGITYAQD